MTRADAKNADLEKPPYSNLKEYAAYRRLAISGNVVTDAVRVAEETAEVKQDSSEA